MGSGLGSGLGSEIRSKIGNGLGCKLGACSSFGLGALIADGIGTFSHLFRPSSRASLCGFRRKHRQVSLRFKGRRVPFSVKGSGALHHFSKWVFPIHFLKSIKVAK